MGEQTSAYRSDGFRFNEKYLSQVPALQLLINLGFEYLPPAKALAARLGKTGNILLEGILREQLKRLNRIHHKGREFLFSEENIQTGIQKLKNVKYDGFDISEHYRAAWQGTGFKAQLVAPSKAAALKYHEHLSDVGFVTSEVLISPPDTREGYEETDEEPTDEVVKFWQKMMKRFGKEEEYTKQIINRFKNGSEPEILIVVSKLLTGFDAPRNIVIYLCKELKEHSLLQAIEDFRAKRLSDLDYLNKVMDIRTRVVTRHHDALIERAMQVAKSRNGR